MNVDALEIGKKMVEMVPQGRRQEWEFVKQFYAGNIVSIEAQGSEEMPARIEGIDAIEGKHSWFYDNNEVHSTKLEGPFVGHRDDQYAMRFILDVTPKGGERTQMTEVGLYTVKDDKIVQEEYLYLMA